MSPVRTTGFEKQTGSRSILQAPTCKGKCRYYPALWWRFILLSCSTLQFNRISPFCFLSL